MSKKIPQYVIDKAIKLRLEQGLTAPEIAEMLGHSKSTVSAWLEDYPLEERTQKQSDAQKRGTEANKEKSAALRQEAYDETWQQAPELMKNREFRDFICMYIGEGSKKDRNRVAIVNSDAAIMKLSYFWISKLRNTNNNMFFGVQIHEDHDEEEIKAYWAKVINIDPEIIVVTRKSNSGKLSGRNFRSVWGLLTIQANDTYFMSKMFAWMDYLRKEWLDKYRP